MLRFGPEASLLAAKIHENQLPARREPLRGNTIQELPPVLAKLLGSQPLQGCNG